MFSAFVIIDNKGIKYQHFAVSAQSSQTLTQDGSSFESASSMYSLARGDAICEDVSHVEEMPLPEIPKQKVMKTDPSPTHSVSSTSSGSYHSKDKASSRCILPTVVIGSQRKNKNESITDDDREDCDYEDDEDDEKSEKRYSSSGYYESPQEDDETKNIRQRKQKDWTEEERRRKKGNFRLEFEKNGSKALAHPIPKPIIGFKQISPEDRTALNILDGTSPSKGRKFRPKAKRFISFVYHIILTIFIFSTFLRSPRNRCTNSGDDSQIRRSKGNSVLKSPEKHSFTPNSAISTPKLNPPNYTAHKIQRSPGNSPRKIGHLRSTPTKDTEKRLKALSTESLRSVSPGSDSVFYSEVDALSDHQVHCHHCGKEVEIVTAVCESQDSITNVEGDRPINIVQPPAGFADSPDAVRVPHHRIYKKLDKRFRSEERHGDRRHNRVHKDTRAKV